MKITINHPTEEAIRFAHEYLNQERDELPTYELTMPSKLIGIVNAEKLRKGKFDNTEYNIELGEFKWLHYFIIKRLLERIQETKRMSIRQMSNEVGLNPASYKLFKTSRKSINGGKKRTVRRVRRARRIRA